MTRERHHFGKWAPGEEEKASRRCKAALLDDEEPTTVSTAQERFGPTIVRRVLSSLTPEEYKRVMERRSKAMPRRDQ